MTYSYTLITEQNVYYFVVSYNKTLGTFSDIQQVCSCILAYMFLYIHGITWYIGIYSMYLEGFSD